MEIPQENIRELFNCSLSSISSSQNDKNELLNVLKNPKPEYFETIQSNIFNQLLNILNDQHDNVEHIAIVVKALVAIQMYNFEFYENNETQFILMIAILLKDLQSFLEDDEIIYYTTASDIIDNLLTLCQRSDDDRTKIISWILQNIFNNIYLAPNMLFYKILIQAINDELDHLDLQSRDLCFQKIEPFLEKIVNVFKNCGDFDLQSLILELLFVLKTDHFTLTCQWFQGDELKSFRKKYRKFQLENFNYNLRMLIYQFNVVSKKVYSIICCKVCTQNTTFVCPKIPNGNCGFWIDFNIKLKSLFFCYDRSTFDSNSERIWGSITIPYKIVSEVVLNKLSSKKRNRIKLKIETNSTFLISNKEDQNNILSKTLVIIFEASEETTFLEKYVLPSMYGNRLKIDDNKKESRAFIGTIIKTMEAENVDSSLNASSISLAGFKDKIENNSQSFEKGWNPIIVNKSELSTIQEESNFSVATELISQESSINSKRIKTQKKYFKASVSLNENKTVPVRPKRKWIRSKTITIDNNQNELTKSDTPKSIVERNTKYVCSFENINDSIKSKSKLVFSKTVVSNFNETNQNESPTENQRSVNKTSKNFQRCIAFEQEPSKNETFEIEKKMVEETSNEPLRTNKIHNIVILEETIIKHAHTVEENCNQVSEILPIDLNINDQLSKSNDELKQTKEVLENSKNDSTITEQLNCTIESLNCTNESISIHKQRKYYGCVVNPGDSQRDHSPNSEDKVENFVGEYLTLLPHDVSQNGKNISSQDQLQPKDNLTITQKIQPEDLYEPVPPSQNPKMPSYEKMIHLEKWLKIATDAQNENQIASSPKAASLSNYSRYEDDEKNSKSKKTSWFSLTDINSPQIANEEINNNRQFPSLLETGLLLDDENESLEKNLLSISQSFQKDIDDIITATPKNVSNNKEKESKIDLEPLQENVSVINETENILDPTITQSLPNTQLLSSQEDSTEWWNEKSIKTNESLDTLDATQKTLSTFKKKRKLYDPTIEILDLTEDCETNFDRIPEKNIKIVDPKVNFSYKKQPLNQSNEKNSDVYNPKNIELLSFLLPFNISSKTSVTLNEYKDCLKNDRRILNTSRNITKKKVKQTSSSSYSLRKNGNNKMFESLEYNQIETITTVKSVSPRKQQKSKQPVEKKKSNDKTKSSSNSPKLIERIKSLSFTNTKSSKKLENPIQTQAVKTLENTKLNKINPETVTIEAIKENDKFLATQDNRKTSRKKSKSYTKSPERVIESETLETFESTISPKRQKQANSSIGKISKDPITPEWNTSESSFTSPDVIDLTIDEDFSSPDLIPSTPQTDTNSKTLSFRTQKQPLLNLSFSSEDGDPVILQVKAMVHV